MWTNYFTIAMRNLLKRKGFTLLNIFGLTLGITCCLLLFQYVSYEKGYDEFLGNDKPLIRLNMKSFEQGKSKHETASTFPFVAPALASNFPEIEQYCRLLAMDAEPEVEERGTALKNVPGTYFSDSSAIGMFGLEIIHGSSLSMNLPMHMLISEALAKNLFGKNDPVGKTIAFKSEWDKWLMTVDGIFKNFPEHSHLPIEGLASISSINQIGIKNNGDTNALATMKDWDIFNTYLQIKQGTDQKKFNEKIKRYTANINSESFLRKANRKVDLVPIPVKNIHLDSNADYELKINGDSKRVSYMFLISIFILLIAWVNYINLATTQAVERAKEVGIRKTAGARRISLVFQFMTENILLHLFALSAGIIIAVLLTSYFNHLTGLGSGKEFYISPRYWILFSIIFISGLLLSGAYPAWILSGYKPIQVLKGQFKNSSKGLVLRKSLIIMQFAVSNFLVAGTLIVYMQVKFMHSQPLGFNMDQVLIIEGPRSVINDDFIKLKQPFENELLQVPGVKAYTVSTFPMGSEMIWSNQVPVEGSEDAKTIFHNAVDFNFIPTYGIAMKAGRNYSKSFGLEQDKVIINETACREFGFKSPQDAIGKVLNHPFGKKTIIGVFADFHHRSLEKPVQPQLLYLDPNERRNYSLKIVTANFPVTIVQLQKLWKKYFGTSPFNYNFLDEIFERQYKASNQFGNIFAVFSIVAIVIACFGLLGLIAFSITQRTKEIGIRKVLGATVKTIVVILSKDFLKLLVIAFIISIPVSWLVMHQWLLDYAYRINITWWIFAVAGSSAGLIALSTISLKTINAARMNPVKSLRSE